MNVYDISANRNDLAVVAGEETAVELTVTNTSGKPSTAIVSVRDRDRGEVDWLRFEHDPQRNFDADETGVIPLIIATTERAEPGDSLVTVLIASEHNPDEDFATFDLALKVDGPEVKRRRLWLWWLLGAAAMLLLGVLIGLLVGIAVASEAMAVPQVVGQPVAAAVDEVDRDFEPLVVASTGDERDEEDFRLAAAGWIAEIRTALWAADEDRREEADDENAAAPKAGDPRWRQLATDYPEVLAERNEVGRVWALDPDPGAEIKAGTEVELRVIPPVAPGPDITGLTPLAAVEHLVDADLRFHLRFAFPEGYRYGDLDAGIWVWSVEPALDLIPRRTRVVVKSLPEHIAIPDLVRMPLDDLPKQAQLNLRYLYHYDRKQKRIATSWADLRKWLDVQQIHGRSGFAYRQDPAPGTLVPTKDHLITVFVDTRSGTVAAR